LVLLRCFRPDKFIFAARDFVCRNLGSEYVQVPSFDLSSSYKDADCKMPIILILSPGSDPLSAVQSFIPGKKNVSISATFVGMGYFYFLLLYFVC